MNERAGPRLLPPGAPAPACSTSLIERGRGQRAARRPASSPTRSPTCTCAREILRLTGLTRPDRRSSSTASPGPEGSLTKWLWSDTNQQLTQLAADVRRPRGADRGHAAGATSCCARAATRSRAAPPRSSRTSSPSACSACRGPLGGASMDFDFTDDQQEIKRTAHDLLAERARRCEQRARGRRGRRLRRRALDASSASSAGRASPSPRSTAARASALVELASCSRSSATRARPTPFLATALAALRDRARRLGRAARALAPRLARARHAARSARRATASPRWSPDADGADVIVLVDADGRGARGRRPSADVEPVDAIDPTRRHAPRGRGRRAARRRRRAALDRALRRGRRRARRRLPARAGDDRRLRQGPQAVRHAGRRLPGRLAPLRADAARHRGRARRRPTSRPGPPTPSPSGCRGGGDGQGVGVATPAATSPPPRSSCTAASASPGRPTCTGCTSARRSIAGSSAAAGHTARPLRRCCGPRWRRAKR